MKLWELEANCLKLVFADSDMTFGKADFGITTDLSGNETVGENSLDELNGNTKQYLVRITDSINRAIDYYREYCGRDIAVFPAHLYIEYYNALGEQATSSEYATKLRFNRILIPDYPIFSIKRIYVVNNKNKQLSDDNIDFEIISENGKQFIQLVDDFVDLEDYCDEQIWDFTVEYEIQYPYVTTETSILTDLSTFDIPLPIQNMIPVFVKSEIYEEDEPKLALNAKNDYINFLIRFAKNRKNVQKRVKTAPIFLKR